MCPDSVEPGPPPCASAGFNSVRTHPCSILARVHATIRQQAASYAFQERLTHL